jgi:hypothetical protein
MSMRLIRSSRAARLAVAAVALGVVAGSAAAVSAAAGGGSRDHDGDGGDPSIRESLSGYEETPLALSTTGNGSFRAMVSEQQQEITYQLSYDALEGSVTQSHIHFGARAQTGGISVFLCTNLGNGPAGTQACPAAPATITGTIRPADVIGPTGQGITAGQFDELLAAIRSGTAYVNVHSTLYPGGEIRSQIENGHHHHH